MGEPRREEAQRIAWQNALADLIASLGPIEKATVHIDARRRATTRTLRP